MRRLLHFLRSILYWTIPILILYVVFQQVDLNELKKSISLANMALVLLGVSLSPILILVGALRWQILLRYYNNADIRLTYSLKHYWIGLSLSVFAPGSLGLDAYRVIVVGRRFGRYMLNIVVIIVDKFLALVTCMLLIILLYPFMAFTSTSPLIKHLLIVTYSLLLGIVILLIAVILARRTTLARLLLVKLEERVSSTLHNTSKRLGIKKAQEPITIPLRQVARPLYAPKHILVVLGLAFVMQFVSAVAVQIFFLGVAHPIPLVVNLFVAPVLFFVTTLPISFGGLGVREAGFILLYGLFGVPTETALLVSFCSFCGLILNYLIGGLLMISCRMSTQSFRHKN